MSPVNMHILAILSGQPNLFKTNSYTASVYKKPNSVIPANLGLLNQRLLRGECNNTPATTQQCIIRLHYKHVDDIQKV